VLAGSWRRIAGDALGADAHIGNMATEDFLGCLSKAGIETVGSSLRVLPRRRAKDTRAEVIKQVAGTTYVHPAAHFALGKWAPQWTRPGLGRRAGMRRR
jgi:ParB family chromosome partitioning protein